MHANPAFGEAMERLAKWGADILVPPIEEGKLKVPDEELIVDHALRTLGPRTLRGKSVLVVSGSTEEEIDDVRVVTNRSSGRTGLALAREAFIRGAEVEMLVGPRHPEPPPYAKRSVFTTVESLAKLVESRKADIALVPAAISDFTPERSEGKIPSDSKSFQMRMRQAQKVIPLVAKRCKRVVGFKLESRVTEEELVERAHRRGKQHHLDLVVANRLEDVGEESSVAHLVDQDGNSVVVSGSREQLAQAVFDRLEQA
jgi:phosphopantothenoylcysteine decarboxylase/phosphopantothenate--cysteine ligase